MLFCTLPFLVFFVVVFTLYWLIPHARVRVWLLLAASFYFYTLWNAWLAILIVVTSCLDYLFAHGMERSETAWLRRFLFILSLVVNLGLLIYFKYANFFIQSFVEMLHSLGYSGSVATLKVILPVGISFYTFEAINYTADVYRKRISAERDLSHFLLFILFFPHLVAGPIVRASDFLHQVKKRKHWNWTRILLGISLFLLGWIKKTVMADHMALLADPVFANPAAYSTQGTWLALLAYALQIYGDFSGYTDMALGCAHLLGYRLTQNFNMPYLAVNISEFWHRWHMSLSGWLRDYLFIPLGGSRGTVTKTARNLLVTMTLGGLWHGASWTFVLWGVVHGSLLIGHRAFRAVCKSWPALDNVLMTPVGTSLRWGLTFLCVAFCWVLFRSATLPAAGTIFFHLLTGHTGLGAPLPAQVLWIMLAGVALAHFLGSTRIWQFLAEKAPSPVLGAAYAVGLLLVLVFSNDQTKSFIYFQF